MLNRDVEETRAALKISLLQKLAARRALVRVAREEHPLRDDLASVRHRRRLVRRTDLEALQLFAELFLHRARQREHLVFRFSALERECVRGLLLRLVRVEVAVAEA